MKSLFTVIGKNLKIFGRSHFSAIIMFLIPLLVVFLVGTAYSSDSLSGLELGTYSPSYSELSNSILSGLETEGFTIIRFESQEQCLNSVRLGDAHICMIFPENMQIEDSNKEIVYHVDNSRLNLAYALINQVESIISVKAGEIGTALAQDILTTLSNAKDSLDEQKELVSSSVNDVEEINDDAYSFTVPSLAGTIEELREAEALAESSNSSTLKSKISSAISDLESAEGSGASASASLQDIRSRSEDAKADLDKVSSELDSLIASFSTLSGTTADDVVSPISSKVESLHSEGTNWNFLFPTLVALMVLFSSIILASNLVAADKKSRSYFRNFITPTSDTTFILGICFTCLIILVTQLIILFTGAIYLTDINIDIALLSVAFVLLIASPTFIFLGMFVGYTFKSEETAVLVALSIAFILMFFSNTIFPVETITGYFKYVAEYNPFLITELILKQIILFNAQIPSFQIGLYLLLGELILFFSLALIARKTTKRFI